MLDLHAVSSGGGTTLTLIGTILLGNDGQSAAGVPIAPGATLINWGAMTTIADTISRLQMLSQDQIDPINGEDFNLGASSLEGIFDSDTFLPFRQGRRSISMLQNTAGANNMGWTIDSYQHGPTVPIPNARLSRNVKLQTTSGALAAITWLATALAPTTLPPEGRYAILGAWVSALTNYGLIRYSHVDFLGKKPGFPVQDHINTAVANAVDPSTSRILKQDGYQFVYLNDIPVFRITTAGTGLVMELAAITADTPRIVTNLAYLGR